MNECRPLSVRLVENPSDGRYEVAALHVAVLVHALHERGNVDAYARVAAAVGSNLGADGDVAEVDKHVDLPGAALLFVVLQRHDLDVLDELRGAEHGCRDGG